MSPNNSRQKILVISWSHIGDTVMSTAAVKMIRNSYPYAFISLLTSPTCLPLLDSRELADECITIPITKGFRRLLIEIATIFKFRSYDCCFFFGHPQIKILRTCRRAGIPVRITASHELDDRHNKAAQYATKTIKMRGPKFTLDHVSDYYMNIIQGHIPEALRHDIAIKLPKTTSFSDKAGARKKIAFCLYGSKNNMARWPEENFATLMRKFDPKHYYLYAAASGMELKRTQEMAERNQLPLHCMETPNLENCASLLQEADLLLGVDTGQLHIAAALGVPVIALSGKTAAFTYPKGKKAMTLCSVKSCQSCAHTETCPATTRKKIYNSFIPECMLVLTPDIVYEHSLLLIHGLLPPSPYIICQPNKNC